MTKNKIKKYLYFKNKIQIQDQKKISFDNKNFKILIY